MLNRPDAGFSLVESLIALVLTLLVAGAVFALLNPNTMSAQAQPEVMDLQQRARAAADLLLRDLAMAGAGVYAGPRSGALARFFAPIVPRKMGRQGADHYTTARSDAITISYVPSTFAQTTLQEPFEPGVPLKLVDAPSCPNSSRACGFEQGMVVLVFDDLSHFDLFSATLVQSDSVFVASHSQDLSTSYQPGAQVTQAESYTYWFDAAKRQLRQSDGYQTDVPVVDNVVSVSFEYFGDPNPPTSPKPPAGVPNCLYDADGNQVAGLAILPAEGGSLAPLPLSILRDGPWCGGGDNRFDADLLRVRKVRVTIRLQAGQATFRATGSALRVIPDLEIRFDVSPRNMNLGR